jgi:hypothetical protein
MSRCATAGQRRPCKRRLPSPAKSKEGDTEKREDDSKRLVREDRIREQTGVEGTGTKGFPEGLADHDIHRLVRVTA